MPGSVSFSFPRKGLHLWKLLKQCIDRQRDVSKESLSKSLLICYIVLNQYLRGRFDKLDTIYYNNILTCRNIITTRMHRNKANLNANCFTLLVATSSNRFNLLRVKKKHHIKCTTTAKNGYYNICSTFQKKAEACIQHGTHVMHT